MVVTELVWGRSSFSSLVDRGVIPGGSHYAVLLRGGGGERPVSKGGNEEKKSRRQRTQEAHDQEGKSGQGGCEGFGGVRGGFHGIRNKGQPVTGPG